MADKKNLEHKGNFTTHPFAELLVEIVQAKFSGSLRLSNESQKTVMYFRRGEVVYGVSNSKALRLFNLLLRKNRIDTKAISRFPNFANDLEFSASLIAAGTLTKEDIDAATVAQIEDIIVDALTWPGGEWIFNPLARARDDLTFPIDIYKVLVDYARCAPGKTVFERFKSIQESFVMIPEHKQHSVNLQAHEAFILARFEQHSLTIEELRSMCSLPDAGLYQALYVLWLGGLLERRDWNAAFSPTKIGEILTARVALVKEAEEIAAPEQKKPERILPIPETVIKESQKLPEITISLEEYLERTEKSETHYDLLGVTTDADTTEIKHSYFSLAKLFHPDRYHRESAIVLRRIQVAFTELAHAYETLKTKESRENYDFKMRKEIDAKEKRQAAGQTDADNPIDRKAEQGLENFEQGLNMLNEEEYAAAAGYLGRAVHYNPQNALYHAYLGKALSADEKQRHKAESEMQTAVRLDARNPKIRIMLAEFFIEMNMLKRAEGELKRFLELAPNNKEALALLGKIRA